MPSTGIKNSVNPMNQNNTWPGPYWPDATENGPPGRRRYLPDGAYDFFLSVDSVSRTRALLLGLGTGDIHVPEQLPQARGFSMEVVDVMLPGPGSATTALQLSLLQLSYADIFDALVEDVATSANSKANLQSAVTGVIDRVSRWKQLLDDLPADGLGGSAQLGLYGELWFMKTHGIPAWGTEGSVNAWLGPLAANQDFQRGTCAVEVKSSGAADPHLISIANPRQLDGTPFESLLLSFVLLERLQGTGETLTEMVASLRTGSREAGVGALFEERLLAAGYHDSHHDAYDSTGYVLREHKFFRVEGDFPRILESDLKTGVENVRYGVSLAAAESYVVADGQVTTIQEEGVQS